MVVVVRFFIEGVSSRVVFGGQPEAVAALGRERENYYDTCAALFLILSNLFLIPLERVVWHEIFFTTRAERIRN